MCICLHAYVFFACVCACVFYDYFHICVYLGAYVCVSVHVYVVSRILTGRL